MAVISADSQEKIQQILLDDELVSKKQLETAKETAKEQDNPLLATLVDEGLITQEQLTKTLAKASGIPYVNLQDATIDPDILKLLPKETAEQYMAVPLGKMDEKLAVAMLDPNNVQAVDFLSRKIGQDITVFMASQEGISQVLSQYGATMDVDVSNVLGSRELKKQQQEVEGQGGEGEHIAQIVQDSPVTRVLKEILDYAVESRASDVHIEPTEDDVNVRIRVDGILHEVMTLPKSVEAALVSRVKILANLKIDEHRLPQDGQFNYKTKGKEIDLRVAVSPVIWGEQVVLRLLDQSETMTSLGSLGFNGRDLELVKEAMHEPNGMILSTGPTGSGKSTSLYTILQNIKDESINIVTLEDPVERKIEGINQIQINPAVGLTFASGLRSVVRQDPDVIMVGEIRDQETASLAVQSALTGHLVLSTLHTNSASGVLPRLLDMGVEPFLIASTINIVIGQRLVRTLCEDKEEYESSDSETQSIKEVLGDVLPEDKKEAKKKAEELQYETLPTSDQNAYTLFKGKPSRKCPGGFKGRIGIFEVLSMTEDMKALMGKQTTSGDIAKQAKKQGMLTMQQDGYLKVLNAYTTLEEVARVSTG